MKDQTANESTSDHAYFQALEAAFIRLRGAPLLLSPADWQTAKSWRREGIPLELVVQVMERIFERQATSGNQGGIKSLRYFKKAVERSWSRVLELGGGEREESEGQLFDIPARLERLAAALPKSLPVRVTVGKKLSPRGPLEAAIAGVAERISSLHGAIRDVEAALQRLDREMMDRLGEGLEAAVLAAVSNQAEESLAALSGRLTAEDRERTLELLIRRRLRQDLKLPVLSLFSREAVGPERG